MPSRIRCWSSTTSTRTMCSWFCLLMLFSLLAVTAPGAREERAPHEGRSGDRRTERGALSWPAFHLQCAPNQLQPLAHALQAIASLASRLQGGQLVYVESLAIVGQP